MAPTPPPRTQPSPKITVTHPPKQAGGAGQPRAAAAPAQPQPEQPSKLALIKEELRKRGYKVVKVAKGKVIAKKEQQVRLELPEGSPYPYFLKNARKADTDPYRDIWYGDVEVEVEFSIQDSGNGLKLIPTKTTSQDLQSMNEILGDYAKRGWPDRPSTIVINPGNMTTYNPKPLVLKSTRTVKRTVIHTVPLPDALWKPRQENTNTQKTTVYRPAEGQKTYDFTGYEEYYRGRYEMERQLGLGRYNNNVQYVEVGGKVYPVRLYRNEVVFVNPASFGRYLGAEARLLLPAVATIFGAAVYGTARKLEGEHTTPGETKTGEIGLPLPEYARKFGKEEQEEEKYREWSPNIRASEANIVKDVEIEKEVFIPRTEEITISRNRNRLEERSTLISTNAHAYMPGEIDITRELEREVGVFPTEIILTNRFVNSGKYAHSDVNPDEELPIDLPGAGYAYVNRYEYKTRNRFRNRFIPRFSFDFPRLNLTMPKLHAHKPKRVRGTRPVPLGELDLFAQGILDLEGIEVARIDTKKFRKLYSSGEALWKEDLSLLASPKRPRSRKKKGGRSRKSGGNKKKGRRSRKWSLL